MQSTRQASRTMLRRSLIAVALQLTLQNAVYGQANEKAVADGNMEPKVVSGPLFMDLFPQDGISADWTVTTWNDVSKPAEAGVHWKVVDGVLRGSETRGTWLMSKKEYGDFELHFEFKLGERGNSGLALRAPMHGDPAFDGLELQMADLRYNPDAKDSELTGGIYRAISPARQVYKPTEWNRYEVKFKGSRLYVKLNDVVIHDSDLDHHTEPLKRHDGRNAPAIKDRPRRGHIGFQELSRGDGRVQIRAARIREL